MRRSLALVAVLLTPSALWAALDRSSWSWDPARIGRNAGELWWTLRLEPLAWPLRMLDQQGAWPPLPAWVGQLFFGAGLTLGNVPFALHIAVLAVQGLTLLLIAGIVRAMFPGDHLRAALAVLIAAAAPLFTGMSNQVFAEPSQTVAVAWTCWIAAHAAHRPPRTTARDLVAALSVGLLAKATTPLYVAGPAVVASVVAWRRRAEPGRWTGIGLAVVPAGATLAWYGRHLGEAFGHLHSGMIDVDGLPAVQSWSIPAEIQHSFLLPVEGALLLVALIAAFRRLPRPGLAPRAAIALAAGHLALVVLALASHHNREPRFLLPLLPLLAPAVGALPGTRPRSVALAAGIVVLTVQWLRVSAMSLGFGEPMAGVSHWVVPPDRQEMTCGWPPPWRGLPARPTGRRRWT